MGLQLIIFVDPSHQDQDRASLLAAVAKLLPEGRFVEDRDHGGVQRVLTYDFETKPDPKTLERLDHLAWVSSSEGTAWTGPVSEPPPREGSGQCPFAALAESMSEEELQAVLAEHRASQQRSS